MLAGISRAIIFSKSVLMNRNVLSGKPSVKRFPPEQFRQPRKLFGVGLGQSCRAEVRRRLGAFGLQLTPNKAAEFVFRLFQPHFFVSIFSIFPQFLASVAFSGEITEGSWAIAQS